MVLVCDVGGGTTDFSLIAVADDGGDLALERVAVGDHILLGGDNMDLALAALGRRATCGQARSTRCSSARWSTPAGARRSSCSATRRARAALPVAILGRGSKLIGGTLKAELTRADAEALLVDGFFPAVAADARAERRRAGGLRELGLPYAHDPAITRHLAAFLGRFGRMPTRTCCSTAA